MTDMSKNMSDFHYRRIKLLIEYFENKENYMIVQLYRNKVSLYNNFNIQTN